MRIHHLNCGTMCPVGGAMTAGPGRGGKLVCHCLLLETPHGLVLVDTGLGMYDAMKPLPRLSAAYMRLLGLTLDPGETALSQIEALGFSARDVRHILLTHLDFDHAGGLNDFPEAGVHVLEPELRAATERRGPVAQRRYRPAQWSRGVKWHCYRGGGEPWFGFDCVRGLAGLPPDFLLVPLIGHTLGHSGVAIRTGQGWLLHAGDAYFFHDEVHGAHGHCPPGLRAYQMLMEVDREARLGNQARLRALARDHGREVRIFCAHDARELPVGQGRALAERQGGSYPPPRTRAAGDLRPRI